MNGPRDGPKFTGSFACKLRALQFMELLAVTSLYITHSDCSCLPVAALSDSRFFAGMPNDVQM